MNKIIIVLLVIFIVVLLYYIFIRGASSLTSTQDATEHQVIDASTISSDNSSNFSYSVWFYVNDWNYRYGESKVVISRKNGDHKPSPSITLGAMTNDITTSVACYPQNGDPSSDTTDLSLNPLSNVSIIHQCELNNFPLQEWVNVIISVSDRVLDIYINGKLAKTCVLPGVPKVNGSSNIDITPSGGFSGYTSNIQYWGSPKNPDQAMSIYKSGFGGNSVTTMFNKYQVKVTFVEDNVDKGSFQI